MYFVVFWKNIELSKIELNILNPSNLKIVWNVAFFETDNYDFLSKLSGIVKYWKLINENEFVFDSKVILWTNNLDFANYIKKKYWIKRYKIIWLQNTDLEIKNKWIEILNFDWKCCLVKWYQNIDLYSNIDYDKSISGMNVGMMPSKLTHLMINLWIFSSDNFVNNLSIYDPFVGFGTTWFVANWLWYNFIWSDINISSVKKNLKWRNETNFVNNDKKFTLYKHDVNDLFKKSFLKNVNVIVSEWFLWPLVSRKTKKHEYINNQKKVLELYKRFFDNVIAFWWKNNINLCITFPYYLESDSNFLETELSFHIKNLWQKFFVPKTIYHRKKQLVWRKFIIFE